MARNSKLRSWPLPERSPKLPWRLAPSRLGSIYLKRHACSSQCSRGGARPTPSHFPPRHPARGPVTIVGVAPSDAQNVAERLVSVRAGVRGPARATPKITAGGKRVTLRRGVRGTLPQPLRKPWPKKRNGACVFARTNARTMVINAKRHRLREPIKRHRARKPTQLMGVASPKITGLRGGQ